MVSVSHLEYVRIGARDLKAWEKFGRVFMGLQLSHEDADNIYFRMDEAAFRIHVQRSGADDVLALGFSLPSQEALTTLSNHLASQGVAVTPGGPDEARARQAKALVSCSDPNGINIELVCGSARVSAPFKPDRPSDGFVTGESGLGHAVIMVDSVQASQAFYCKGLGLRLTDHVTVPPLGDIPFLHCNPRHHTVALIPTASKSVKRLNHIQVQMQSLDDLGKSYDVAQEWGIVTTSLGKHPNDGATSFFVRNPSGFLVEVAWGGVYVDDAVWRPQIHPEGAIWGHHRHPTT